MNPNDIPLPQDWPQHIRSAMLHIISLAHMAIIYTRSWCANSSISRVRLAGKLEQAKNEISMLQEEIRIKDARVEKIASRHRPYYPPWERMAILELKAARGWNVAQTARIFHVEPDTIAEWMKRINDDSLIRTPEPLNKFPQFVRYIVQRLKVLCPTMGKKKIAQVLARAGLYLSASTVGRMLKTRSRPKPSSDRFFGNEQQIPRVVNARYPNHVWHVDLTVVPTSKGFWASWFPNALPQVWPFCYWVGIVIDHFSRSVMGFAVFKKQPTSIELRAFIWRTIHKNKAKPRHLISDKGPQFDCDAFRKWCKRKKIKQRYGAVGKYGSIAIIERFIRSMKHEYTNQIPVALKLNEMRFDLGLYITWYNEHRPHQTLSGRTPTEVYCNSPPTICSFAGIPNSNLPEVDLHLSYFAGRKQLPIAELVIAG